MIEIFILNGVPKKLIYHRDVKFTSSFSKALLSGFETQLKFSTSYHPEIDGKTKRNNHITEDMI
jgi:hypothetical protein